MILRLVIQTAPTESFVGKTWRQRLDVANGPFREAVSIPEPARVRGQSVLLIGDVFTTGLTTHWRRRVSPMGRGDGRLRRWWGDLQVRITDPEVRRLREGVLRHWGVQRHAGPPSPGVASPAWWSASRPLSTG